MEIINSGKNSDQFSVARRLMVTKQLIARGITSAKVLEAMRNVPRHFFVDSGLADQAYSDNPMTIGFGQTISQPYIVALSCQSLRLAGDEKIMEVGSGCGYQTAILAMLGKKVYTIERIRELGFMARKNLKNLGYRNIVIRIGDGTYGWREAAPFDAIVVAAGCPEIPAPLLDQLAEGGRMVLPVGNEEGQNLVCITRKGGKPSVEDLGPCRFVKLVGRYGWKEKGPNFTTSGFLARHRTSHRIMRS